MKCKTYVSPIRIPWPDPRPQDPYNSYYLASLNQWSTTKCKACDEPWYGHENTGPGWVEKSNEVWDREEPKVTTFDKVMFLHEIGTALLLSDMGIHIQGTGVEERDYGHWAPDHQKVLIVSMRNGEKYRILVEKEG